MRDPVTIVLIHGHGVDASIWDGIYAGLVLDDAVFRPDFSRLTHYNTIDGYAENLYHRLQAESATNVVLVGHSMGGYMALALAERHPAIVRGLCLFHSTAYADDESKKEQRTKAIGALTDGGAPKFIAELIPKMVSPDYAGAGVQTLIDRFSDLPADALTAGVRAIAGRPDRTHVLRTAQFPVLIMAGQQDQIIPLDKNQELADMAPDTEFVVIEACGHLGMIEQPDQTLNVLTSFVARL